MSFKNLSSEQRRLFVLLGLLGAAGVFVFVYYLINPLVRRGQDLKTELQSTREQVRSMETVAAQLPRLAQEHERLTEAVAMWKDRMPDQDSLPDVISKLSAFAQDAGVKIQTIMPHPAEEPEVLPGETETPGGAAYQGVPIQIDASAGYHSLGRFVNMIERSESPMHVLSLRVTHDTNPYQHRIQLLIRAYFSVQHPQRPGNDV